MALFVRAVDTAHKIQPHGYDRQDLIHAVEVEMEDIPEQHDQKDREHGCHQESDRGDFEKNMKPTPGCKTLYYIFNQFFLFVQESFPPLMKAGAENESVIGARPLRS
jgi:hypothetical protein